MNTNRKTFRAAQWGKVLLLAFLAMGLPGHGEATSGSFNAPIEIITTPLTATQTSSLSFGNPTCGDDVSGCTISISSFGICSVVSGPGTCRNTFLNPIRSARFTVTGAPDAFFNITLPASIKLIDTFNGQGLPDEGTFFNRNFTGALDSSGNRALRFGAKVSFRTSTLGLGSTTFAVISNFAITVSYQ